MLPSARAKASSSPSASSSDMSPGQPYAATAAASSAAWACESSDGHSLYCAPLLRCPLRCGRPPGPRPVVSCRVEHYLPPAVRSLPRSPEAPPSSRGRPCSSSFEEVDSRLSVALWVLSAMASLPLRASPRSRECLWAGLRRESARVPAPHDCR